MKKREKEGKKKKKEIGTEGESRRWTRKNISKKTKEEKKGR